MAIEHFKFEPLVSIIIPVYNGSDYMREAIDSALAQTYKKIEVIVVNDGSMDDGKTDRIARSYGDKIRYFSKENGGVSTALNKGIIEAKGEYISWLSHDDVYIKDKIMRQVQYLNEHFNEGIDRWILYSNYSIIDENSRKIGTMKNPPTAPEQFYEALLSKPEFVMNGCTALIPRNAFECVGLFNEKLRTSQDYDMWLRLNKKFDFILMDEYLVLYRHHGKQGTNVMSKRFRRESEEFYYNALDLYDEKDPKFSFRSLAKATLGLKRRRCDRAYARAYKMASSKKKTFAERCYLLYSRLWNWRFRALYWGNIKMLPGRVMKRKGTRNGK